MLLTIILCFFFSFLVSFYDRRSPDLADEGGDTTAHKYAFEYYLMMEKLKQQPLETEEDGITIRTLVSKLIVLAKKALNVDAAWRPAAERERVAYQNSEILKDSFMFVELDWRCDPVSLPLKFVQEHHKCAPFDPKTWSARHFNEEAFCHRCGRTCKCICVQYNP